jgi:hypothetical protein
MNRRKHARIAKQIGVLDGMTVRKGIQNEVCFNTGRKSTKYSCYNHIPMASGL